MRNGQNKRMRGRNRKGGHHHHHQNPLSRVFESNGPDVKIRGPASHVAEKYLQLARDAQSSGDPVAAENYYQQQPGADSRANVSEEGYEEGDSEQSSADGEPFAPRETQQPFYPRDQHHPQGQPPHTPPRPQFQSPNNEGDVDRLPSFITGGGQPQASPPQQGQGSNNSNGPNGYDGSADRFPLHRRRRRHRGGPRDHSMGGEGGDGPNPGGPRQSDD